MVNVEFQRDRNRVPILSKEDIDDYAESILDDFRPELLSSPCEIPVDEIVRDYFHLEVEYTRLSKNKSILGMLIFSSGSVSLYDQSLSPLITQVKEGTILIDNSVLEPDPIWRYRMILVHETGHWILHKHKYVKGQLRIVTDGQLAAACHRCPKKNVGSIFQYEDLQSGFEWMEWHADYFASSLLMPKLMVEKCIEDGLKKARLTEKEIYDRGDKVFFALRSIVDEISRIFNVSPQAAAIRLNKLGYLSQEILSWIESELDKESAANEHEKYTRIVRYSGQTYSISFPNAVAEYSTNPSFQKVIETGAFLYIENHFCISSPKYVRISDDGESELTEYARQHPEECCLKFTLEKVQYIPVSGNVAYRVPTKTEEKYRQDEDRESFVFESRFIADIMRRLPGSFADSLRAHMARIGVTEEALAERLMVSPKTIQRMLNESEKQQSLGFIIALCIGLQLEPILSYDLIHKSGYSFMPGNVSHVAYQMLLLTEYTAKLPDCNAILEACKVKPLV